MIIINDKIPGWTKVEDLYVLGQMAKRVPDGGIIIELGAWLGRSTWVLCRNSAPTVKVYVIDNWEFMPDKDDPNLLGEDFDRSKDPYELFQNYLEGCDKLVCIKGNTSEVNIPELKGKKVGMIYFDAGHGEWEFKADVLKYLEYIDENTIVCGDDYWEGDYNSPPEWPGLYGMVQWLSKRRLLRPVRRVGVKTWLIDRLES